MHNSMYICYVSTPFFVYSTGIKVPFYSTLELSRVGLSFLHTTYFIRKMIFKKQAAQFEIIFSQK
ncbi:hypothetical protein CLRAG_40110 [Clostridium ragsdalei P11]|uniref:Uncharacterized protein n=1 Tax=Clostridium ragsdalei P11 TaxID=1353534 RepID=A0A1A6AI53_9CLOT|nr:hypothetical protein CLRAG_40110 [Clostridium ragsdalei P11]